MSNLDLATTVAFTNDPRILYDHFAQLLTAVNAVRASAKLGPMATFGPGALILAQHMKADLVLFDAARVIDKSTFQDPKRLPEGISQVFVNGVTVWPVSGARPGIAIRRP